MAVSDVAILAPGSEKIAARHGIRLFCRLHRLSRRRAIDRNAASSSRPSLATSLSVCDCRSTDDRDRRPGELCRVSSGSPEKVIGGYGLLVKKRGERRIHLITRRASSALTAIVVTTRSRELCFGGDVAFAWRWSLTSDLRFADLLSSRIAAAWRSATCCPCSTPAHLARRSLTASTALGGSSCGFMTSSTPCR